MKYSIIAYYSVSIMNYLLTAVKQIKGKVLQLWDCKSGPTDRFWEFKRVNYIQNVQECFKVIKSGLGNISELCYIANYIQQAFDTVELAYAIRSL